MLLAGVNQLRVRDNTFVTLKVYFTIVFHLHSIIRDDIDCERKRHAKQNITRILQY